MNDTNDDTNDTDDGIEGARYRIWAICREALSGKEADALPCGLRVLGYVLADDVEGLRRDCARARAEPGPVARERHGAPGAGDCAVGSQE